MSCVPSRVGSVTRSTAAWSRCNEGQQEQKRPEYAAEHGRFPSKELFSIVTQGRRVCHWARNWTPGGEKWFRDGTRQAHDLPPIFLSLIFLSPETMRGRGSTEK